ncbi:hypothetical protein K438DRAFT_1764996 [Mycena galopus ATCC 62051]|nr:hypothetical protein K438DRAFT_1764996 [Mycena galopus ATCC 62051]
MPRPAKRCTLSAGVTRSARGKNARGELDLDLDLGRAQKNAARRERRYDARACADLPSSTGTARNSTHAQHLEADGAHELYASLFVHQYRGVAHDKNDLHGLARLLDTILLPPGIRGTRRRDEKLQGERMPRASAFSASSQGQTGYDNEDTPRRIHIHNVTPPHH